MVRIEMCRDGRGKLRRVQDAAHDAGDELRTIEGGQVMIASRGTDRAIGEGMVVVDIVLILTLSRLLQPIRCTTK